MLEVVVQRKQKVNLQHIGIVVVHIYPPVTGRRQTLTVERSAPA